VLPTLTPHATSNPSTERVQRWRHVLRERYGVRLVSLLAGRVEAHGVDVVFREFESTKGDLDGARVYMSSVLPLDEAVFLLCHLFGHTAQWHTDPAALEYAGITATTFRDGDAVWVEEYERKASRIGLSLLLGCDVRLLRSWLSEFVEADIRYLLARYRGRTAVSHEEFWPEAVPVLDPIPIPVFRPRVISQYVGGRVL
jgi:hypothetical protein